MLGDGEADEGCLSPIWRAWLTASCATLQNVLEGRGVKHVVPGRVTCRPVL